MTFRIDIRVDPDRHARGMSQALGDRLDAREFPGRLDVDRLQPERHGGFEFRGRLAHTGEDDLVRQKSHAPRHRDLPDGIGVRRAAKPVEESANREVRIGFECVVERVRISREGTIEGVIALAKARGTVDVERGAFSLGNGLQLDTVAHEVLAGAEESSHESTNDYTT